MEIGNGTLLHSGCLEAMAGFADGSIDLVVTSPPYDNLRTYNDMPPFTFAAFQPIARELARLIKPGGVIVWNVADATVNGSETGSSFRQALYFKDECGLNLHDTMIWNKGGFSAVGALATRYAPVFEYMFVFSKGPLGTFNPIKDRPNKHAGGTVHGTVRGADGLFRVAGRKSLLTSDNASTSGTSGRSVNVAGTPRHSRCRSHTTTSLAGAIPATQCSTRSWAAAQPP